MKRFSLLLNGASTVRRLLGPDGKVIIDHNGQEYLLRKTQAGKLLLTK